ncbi:hypothetical protein EBS02_06810, partial [bacterium]|nr:hypothetical protein [bacterium]
SVETMVEEILKKNSSKKELYVNYLIYLVSKDIISFDIIDKKTWNKLFNKSLKLNNTYKDRLKEPKKILSSSSRQQELVLPKPKSSQKTLFQQKETPLWNKIMKNSETPYLDLKDHIQQNYYSSQQSKRFSQQSKRFFQQSKRFFQEHLLKKIRESRKQKGGLTVDIYPIIQQQVSKFLRQTSIPLGYNPLKSDNDDVKYGDSGIWYNFLFEIIDYKKNKAISASLKRWIQHFLPWLAKEDKDIRHFVDTLKKNNPSLPTNTTSINKKTVRVPLINIVEVAVQNEWIKHFQQMETKMMSANAVVPITSVPPTTPITSVPPTTPVTTGPAKTPATTQGDTAPATHEDDDWFHFWFGNKKVPASPPIQQQQEQQSKSPKQVVSTYEINVQSWNILSPELQDRVFVSSSQTRIDQKISQVINMAETADLIFLQELPIDLGFTRRISTALGTKWEARYQEIIASHTGAALRKSRIGILFRTSEWKTVKNENKIVSGRVSKKMSQQEKLQSQKMRVVFDPAVPNPSQRRVSGAVGDDQSTVIYRNFVSILLQHNKSGRFVIAISVHLTRPSSKQKEQSELLTRFRSEIHKMYQYYLEVLTRRRETSPPIIILGGDWNRTMSVDLLFSLGLVKQTDIVAQQGPFVDHVIVKDGQSQLQWTGRRQRGDRDYIIAMGKNVKLKSPNRNQTSEISNASDHPISDHPIIRTWIEFEK